MPRSRCRHSSPRGHTSSAWNARSSWCAGSQCYSCWSPLRSPTSARASSPGSTPWPASARCTRFSCRSSWSNAMSRGCPAAISPRRPTPLWSHWSSSFQAALAAELSRTRQLHRESLALAEENADLSARLRQRLAELETTQAQLVRSTKLAAIGELAANIAHEINNPLTGVLSLVELLHEE